MGLRPIQSIFDNHVLVKLMFIRLLSFIILHIFHIIFLDILSVDTLRYKTSLKHKLNTHSLLFQTLDLVKVFGRLSEPSLIGSVIPSSKERLGKNCTLKKLKWKSLFENEREKLNLREFEKRIYKSPFDWPMDYITNRTAPFLIPIKFRNKFKIKCKCYPICLDMCMNIKDKLAQMYNINNITEVNMEKLNDYISDEPIDKESIESTFKALSGEEDILTVEHMMAYIKYRSPLIEMINWNCFISSLPVGPDDECI